MLRVAVTGATGFVGSHVIRRLIAAGHQVRILARRMPITALTPDRPLEVVLGDLDDEPALHRLVGGVDVVIHVAGVIKARHAAVFHKVNVEGTRHLATALSNASPDLRVIHVSSLAAREPSLSPYCASKRGGEEAIQALANPARLTILRPPAVYGPGDTEIYPMFKAAALGICAYPAAPQGRVSLIHGADLAAAIVAAAETILPDPVYELDDGHAGGYAWTEIGAGLSAALARPVRMIRVPRPVLTAIALGVEAHRRVAGSLTALSLAKVPELYHADWVARGPRLEARTGWKPAFDVTRGFADTLAWYRAIGWLR
ncbi:NAD-dependent epimerase/dehydratase family protein [Dongia sedimenti]|uniref:NAD-dependent epimerase/dehydratase family protein n=1 Tax=Dongia sedimenti TaxID=3064282 RepID=A0ABU0YLF7_9PROT|nr:NAD-dependent epimerase/dehydratase family protein [Rhodospirillaceae bacterium R-7]